MLAATRRRRGRRGASEIYMPGVAGNYISTPDSAAVSIIGDIDIRLKLQLANWGAGTSRMLFSKALTDGQSSFDFALSAASGFPQFRWWPTGLNAGLVNKFGSAATGLAPNTIKWIRVTLDVDNGAAASTLRFYLSDDGVAWAQLGVDNNTAGVASIFDGTDPIQLGANSLGTANLTAGTLLRAQLRNGIDGPLVADLDPTRASVNQLGVLGSTGEKWSLLTAGPDPLRLR